MKKETSYYKLPSNEVIKILNSDLNGLKSEEVKKRQKEYGLNEIINTKKISKLKIFLSQFENYLIYILLFATVLSLAIGNITDSIMIMIIVILNAILGFNQDWKAEKAIRSLKKMLKENVRVIRDNKEMIIDSKYLVPGDIVFLEAGNKISADCRIIESANALVDEASLTGESTPIRKTAVIIKKDVSLAERINMVFSGTIMTNGWSKVVVVKTGMDSELGRIAHLSETAKKEQTHVQKMLDSLGKQLGIISLGLSFSIIPIGIWFGFSWLQMILVSVSLAVAAVPEGLPAVVTITFALAVRKLTGVNLLVRKLSVTDNLGAITYICTDKTGTLTKGQMTVTDIFVDKTDVHVSGVGYKPEGKFSKKPKDLELLFKISALCNHASLTNKDNRWSVVGDPTEGAIIVSAEKYGLNVKQMRTNFPTLSELSFSSERMMMSTVHKMEGEDSGSKKSKDKKYVLYAKGAPEVIVNKCSKILMDGKEKKLDKKRLKEIEDKSLSYSKSGLRVLAMAYKTLNDFNQKKGHTNKVENNLVFVGIQAMMDPPREEVAAALNTAKKAGIHVLMLTGDYKETAVAVAKQIGLLKKGDIALNTKEFSEVSNDYILKNLNKIKVFARVSPEQKMRVLNILKKKGEVVAMTGDGVNDAPSLKRADVGIAMGITGTDVTKESADVILLDDNFASIVRGIAEGRNIGMNIKRFVYYLVSSNLGEIWIVFLALLFKWPLILLAIQLLFMNLVTDSVSALALGMEPKEKDVMKKPPEDPSKPLITKGVFEALFGLSLVKTLWILWIFGELFPENLIYARTMAFAGMIISEKFNLFNFKSFDKPIYKINILNNKYLLAAVLATVLLTVITVQIPFLANLVHVQPLALNDWLFLIGMGSVVFIVGELYKNYVYYFRRNTNKNRR